MKKFFQFIYGATLAVALVPAVTSCSDSDLVEDTTPPVETISDGSEYYIKVAISGVPEQGARAVDAPKFDGGTPTENAINKLYFIFYDNNGGVVGEMASLSLSDLNEVTENLPSAASKSYQGIVPVILAKGQALPTQVMCYINPISTANFNQPLNSLTNIRRAGMWSKSGSDTCFCMSNSVYYPTESANAVPQVATPIPVGAVIKGSHKEGDTPASVVKIYVERYATKVSLDIKDMTIGDYKATSPAGQDPTFYLKFKELKWIVNATDRETFCVKSFAQTENFGTPAASLYGYTALNTILSPAGSSWAWNSIDNSRSYWGFSTSYYSSAYPTVSEDYKGHEEDFLLKYSSYNEINVDAGENVAIGNIGSTSNYYMETTSGAVGLESQNPAAAVAAVVLTGTYDVCTESGTGVQKIENQPSGFYTYGLRTVSVTEGSKPVLYFPIDKNSGECEVSSGTSIYSAMLNNSTILYVKDGNSYRAVTADDMKNVNMRNALTVGRPAASVLGSQKLPSRKVTLQITSVENANTANLYIASNNGYLKLASTPASDAITLDDANSLIASAVQYADYYNGGKAYFNIPIRHYGWYRDGNKNNTGDGKSNVIDWGKVRVGDFGLVRNHSYTVQIESINGLGTAIADPDDPIIPPSETDEYHMHYMINILKWALVPTQSVKL